jgi:hypothetical protein
MGERRDHIESMHMDLETGEIDSGGVWPDRCGWYKSTKKAEVLGMSVSVGEDLVCTYHAAGSLGITADKLARLGLVRDEFFDVHSVESLSEDGTIAVHRDPVSCQQPWIGRCLWDVGYMVLWVNSEDAVDEMLAGSSIEGSLNENEPTIQVWAP